MIIEAGRVDVTTFFLLYDAVTGAPITGATITDMDLSYVREGEVASVKADATALGSVNAIHSANKAIEVDATDMPGVYRVDWPDAAFAVGTRDNDSLPVKEVVLYVHDGAASPAFIDSSLRVVLNPAADAVAVSNDSTAADNVEDFFDDSTSVTNFKNMYNGTGYAGGTAVFQSDITKIHGTAITETGGQLAGAFTKFFNVSSPTGTVNSFPDAVAGAAGGLFIAGSNAATTLDSLTVTNATTLTGAVSLGSTLGISGPVTLSSTLGVGATTLNALTVTNATTLSGAVSLGSTLGVTGATTLTGAVTMTNGLVANITGDITGSLSGTIGSLGTTAKANVNTECDNAIVTYNLDHLAKTAISGGASPTYSEVVDGTVLSWIMTKTGDSSDFTASTDSLEGLQSTTVGSGASEYTLTVVDGSSKVIDNVCCWVTTGATAGTGVVAGPSYTNTDGEVTFMLDAGTRYVWKQHSGYNFTNPEEITVT